MTTLKNEMRGWLRGIAIVFAAAIVISAPAAFAAQQAVRGTATLADGTTLAKGAVNLIDNANHSLAAVANNAGRFRFNVIGLTAPFLLQSIPAGSGSPLFYGYAQGPGIANVDAYTD